MPKYLILCAAACALTATPASAGELFGGLYVHDVDTVLTKSGVEKGSDVLLGWRFGRVGGTPIQPYAYAAVNTAGETNFGAVGLSVKFGDRVFVRPGLGLAIHTGSARDFENTTNGRIDFGSRLLFAPELGIGARLNERMSVEASWIHLSHAQLFGRQNPGLDNFGVRLNVALP